jgi:hypothetical protein
MTRPIKNIFHSGAKQQVVGEKQGTDRKAEQQGIMTDHGGGENSRSQKERPVECRQNTAVTDEQIDA